MAEALQILVLRPNLSLASHTLQSLIPGFFFPYRYNDGVSQVTKAIQIFYCCRTHAWVGTGDWTISCEILYFCWISNIYFCSDKFRCTLHGSRLMVALTPGHLWSRLGLRLLGDFRSGFNGWTTSNLILIWNFVITQTC